MSRFIEKKAQEFWIFKGTSDFCNELVYDVDADMYVKARTDGFYDIVSTADTIEGGIHVVEAKALDEANLKIEQLERSVEFHKQEAEIELAQVGEFRNRQIDLRLEVDRMKLALEKALEQRNKAVEAAVRLITGNDLKQEMDTDFYKEIGIGLTELDAEIQKILEGKE